VKAASPRVKKCGASGQGDNDVVRGATQVLATRTTRLDEDPLLRAEDPRKAR